LCYLYIYNSVSLFITGAIVEGRQIEVEWSEQPFFEERSWIFCVGCVSWCKHTTRMSSVKNKYASFLGC